jgi:predicted amidohydrolase YtcJ
MQKRIFHNGIILTQNEEQPQAEAVAVVDDKIVCVGTLKQARETVGLDAEYIDLQGHTLLPAFNDAHIHIWKVGDLLTYLLDLRGVQSLEEMLDKIADFAQKNPKNKWIMARGFNEINFSDGRLPTRYDLDKAVNDRPCYIIRTCAHIAVVNTKALEVCGITAQTEVPKGGEIRLNMAHPDSIGTEGSPSGILSETAFGLVQKHLPTYTSSVYRDMILAAQAAFLKVGIGSATDPAVPPDLLEVYKSMDKAGELTVRINAVPILVPDGETQPLPLPDSYSSDFLTVNTVKFFTDGGLSGKTAALKRPYKNSSEQGVLRLEFAFFKEIAAKAQAAGFIIATHAIGDQAIELVLNVYEAIAAERSKNRRHRIEHLALPELSHLIRMKNGGVHCVTQPIFLYELGQNFTKHLPDFYLNNLYPYRSVLDAGINLAFSSDAPVVKNFSPLMGIQNAVERRAKTGETIAPTQCISVAEALKAYTQGGALASDEWNKKGSLSIGKYADFVILNKNPLDTEGASLSDIQVLETWIGGKKAKF